MLSKAKEGNAGCIIKEGYTTVAYERSYSLQRY
jgi:hypothetical protein